MIKKLPIFQYSLILCGIILILLSIGKIVYAGSFIPWIMVLLGSTTVTSMLVSVAFSGIKGKKRNILIGLSLLNACLFLAYYYSPGFLKEFYPFSFWCTIAVILYSIQHTIEQRHKRFHSISKTLNYGLIFLILPFLIFKVENQLVWFILIGISGLVLLSNLVIFLLKDDKRSNQSK